MTRKRRRPITPLPPRGLRPKLSADQVQKVALIHIAHLDLVATGQAEWETLRDIAESVFTWSRVAELLGQGEAEMLEQLDLVNAMLERHKRTGRVGFSGPEYQTARRGVAVMDTLAETVDAWTAGEAAAWSVRMLAKVMGEMRDAEAA